MTNQEGVLPHAHHPQPGCLELTPGNEKQWFHGLGGQLSLKTFSWA